jgi:hypothetical protein
VPTFCRHNRFLANCPICSREQAQTAAPKRPGVTRTGGQVTRKRTSASTSTGRGGRDLRVRRIARESDDGFRSTLVPGVKASGDAERLAQEIAFASARIAALASDPPGLYGEVAGAADAEEAAWLAFLIAYLGPLDREDPFAGVRAARTSWTSGAPPELDGVPLGPRTAHDPARGSATLAAYRAWAQRAGSQAAAFGGEAAWTPERRFARAFERLALPGLHRDARFDLLVTLGQLGLFPLRAGALQLGGADETTVAAKRVFAIGDTLLLERRAVELASACEVELAALDLGLWNWSHPPRPAAVGREAESPRASLGFPSEPDADAFARIGAALGL